MKDPQTIIKSAQLTEKGTRLMEKQNKYFFVVDGLANKTEIKKAVQALFKVNVAKVNTMHYDGKAKRERTANYGTTAKWKRAVVTLRDGEKIEFT